MTFKPVYLSCFLALYSFGAHAACNIVNGKAYGDCAGVTVNNQSKGVITVSSYQSESGIIQGARVLSGGTLSLSGISNGNVTVSKGGSLLVTGIVNGIVENNGGSVEIEGQVNHVAAQSGKTVIAGTVSSVSGNTHVIYKSGAVIGGVPKP